MSVIHGNVSLPLPPPQKPPEIECKINGGGYEVQYVALENSLSTSYLYLILHIQVLDAKAYSFYM